MRLIKSTGLVPHSNVRVRVVRKNKSLMYFVSAFALLAQVCLPVIFLAPTVVRALDANNSSPCGDNVLVNGGFESPVVPDAWDVYPDGTANLGWRVSWTETLTGTPPLVANLELQRNVNSWIPSEGSQYAELDSDWDGPLGSISNEPSNVTLSQEISTETGVNYELDFSFSPRPAVFSNSVDVYWNGAQVGSVSASGLSNTNTAWTQYTYALPGVAGMSTLEFREVGTPDSLGSFLDNVSLAKDCGKIISGWKWNDLNGNGILEEDQGEMGIGQWEFEAIDPQTNLSIATDVADDDGYYELYFPSTNNQIVRVVEIDQPGWIQTFPIGSGVYDIDLSTGTNFQDNDFGNHRIEQGPGVITICKILVDNQGAIVDGSAVAGATFTIPWLDTTTPEGSNVVPVPNNAVFTTPLVLNADLLGSDNVNDAACQDFTGLSLGHYYYGQELIVGGNGWASVKYNDQLDQTVDELSDLHLYSGELFTVETSDDQNRNLNADGDLNLTQSRPSRTLVVLNQYQADDQDGSGGPNEAVLTVQITNAENDGEGTVTATGINCDSLVSDSDCNQAFAIGASVELTATAHAGSSFEGSWVSGPCAGTAVPVCQVTMNANQTISAHFSLVQSIGPTSGGGGGGFSGGSGSSGGGSTTPVVLGVNNNTSSTNNNSNTPGDVQGAVAQLPRTGTPVALYFMLVALLFVPLALVVTFNKRKV